MYEYDYEFESSYDIVQAVRPDNPLVLVNCDGSEGSLSECELQLLEWSQLMDVTYIYYMQIHVGCGEYFTPMFIPNQPS